MHYLLTISTGPDAGQRTRIPDRETLLIGRGEICGLRLSDPSASRVHCRIIASGGNVILEDAGSRWGTLVNGVPVETRELRAGDRIAIGDTELRLEIDGSAAETRPPERPRILAPLDGESSPASPPKSIAAVERLVGERFLRFRVGAIVARASSGIIFRALDTRRGRPVALKIFRPDFFEDERATRRFLRAVRTALPLVHPNLVKLHSAGRTQGVCFMVSEYVEGESAAQLIQRVGIAGMLDWRKAWQVAAGVADALAFAHERNIVHRNIGPSNILIRQSDQAVKLGDLMLAKALDEIPAPQITRAGEIVGDLPYLAPEQVSGQPAVDARADVWSLGATMYAILTGRPPFEGRHSAEIIGNILSQEPVPPTRYHLAIPAALEGIVLRMLAKRPEDRFVTAADLLRDVQRIGRYQGLTW